MPVWTCWVGGTFPVDRSKIGADAKAVCPVISQVFVGMGSGAANPDQLERKLYVTRKVIEHSIEDLGLAEEDADYFYICSMSCFTMVYKGLLMAHQINGFYPDLADPLVQSAFALVHSRFSTNTLGHWKLAHPYRYLAHNGEINTLRGNLNWMHAREAQFESPLFGDDMAKVPPVMTAGASDTASFDNALELLLMTGRDLEHAMSMLIPEAWEQHESMPQIKKDFYEYHSCLMEPWDGPAMMVSSNGRSICALLDRNGLRPFRYMVTTDDKLIMGSETGVLDVPPSQVREKGRLQPGRMFLVNLEEGRIIGDEELKTRLANRHPYGQWLQENKVDLDELPEPAPQGALENGALAQPSLVQLQRAFGYTVEELRILTTPMAMEGHEAQGSMGNDTPLAVLSDQDRLLFDYFKQLFAQVSNPPLDAIREELVTSLEAFIGSERNLFDETPLHCRQLKLHSPIINDRDLEKIKQIQAQGLRSITLSTLFEAKGEEGALGAALERLCRQASRAIEDGTSLIILSDRGVNAQHAPIPSLLATSAVHHHLIREGTRTKVGLVVESGEPREVQHFALLIGYGAGAINPYLALASARQIG